MYTYCRSKSAILENPQVLYFEIYNNLEISVRTTLGVIYGCGGLDRNWDAEVVYS